MQSMGLNIKRKVVFLIKKLSKRAVDYSGRYETPSGAVGQYRGGSPPAAKSEHPGVKSTIAHALKQQKKMIKRG